MEQHELKINFPGLLRILGSNIYAEPDMAVREIIQNAHDTCVIRHQEESDFAPRIDISYDRAARTLTFIDNGMGMTKEELHMFLSTIGEGFTKIQREKLHGAGAKEALLLIGQFGIGMLSAFSVAGRVEVYTRSCHRDSPGFRWVCEGNIHYTVEPVTIPDIGTRVVLHLMDSSLVLLDDGRLRQAIKKYADFLSVPIYLNGVQTNSCDPPWIKASSHTDYADYIKARYNLYPLATFPLRFTGPIPLDGLLFIPSIPFELTRDFGEVDIYISRMFIKANDKSLLPTWARFVKGVVNSPALMPILSRDEVVQDANYTLIKEMLGKFILEYLAYLGKHDPETLSIVVKTYNNTIKARSVEDDVFFDHICDLVRVSTSDGYMTMKDYLVKSAGVIYYFSERGTGTQHKLLFAFKGLPVIDASWGMEEEFLEKFAQRKRVKLERLQSDSGIIFRVPETMDEKWHDLERQFRLQLYKEAKAVEFEPNTIPALIVAQPIERDKKDLDQQYALAQEMGISSNKIRQMFDRMAQDRTKRDVEDETMLHLNITNPLMQQMRDMNRNETFRLALTTIYNNAMMFAHHYVSPENAEIIFSSNNTAISAMIGSARALEDLQVTSAKMEIELSELKRKMPQTRLAHHRCCFFAFDYNIEENYELMAQLQQYFTNHDLGIEVIAPAKGIHDINILKSMYEQLYSVHFGFADITGNNPNVLFEAGLLKGLGKPVILLKRQGEETKVPFDIFSDYRIEYQLSKRGSQVKFVWLEEELDKIVRAVFKMLPDLEHAVMWKEE